MVKIIAFIFILASCCGAEPEAPLLSSETGTGGVVAEVDGVPIYASQVEEAAVEAGVSPRAALSGLVDETLMARRAADRGLLLDGDVVGNWKKAMVQKSLEEEVEAVVPEDSVTLEDIKRFYAANFAGRGLLLEQVWKDIRLQILIERRNLVYQKLVKRLEEEHADEITIHQDIVEGLK